MLSKFKKYYFNTMFFLLYASFTVLLFLGITMEVNGTGWEYSGLSMLVLLSFVWLALIAARNLYKKSATHGNSNGGHRNGHFRR